MTSESPFSPPLRATGHCRHYSYRHGDLISDSGPQCAAGCDLSAPAASAACWPSPQATCAQREEYTDEERAEWRAWTRVGMERLETAIAALPTPLKLGARGHVTCPNCGGNLHYSRWHRGAAIECSTKNCCGARFNIGAGADWPSRKEEDVR